MDGADRSNQYWEKGAGFASRTHYTQCYKKAHCAILNFMMLNASFALNITMPGVKHHFPQKGKFYTVLAEEMISFVDGFSTEGITPQTSNTLPLDINGCTSMPVHQVEQMWCAACQLKEGWMYSSK